MKTATTLNLLACLALAIYFGLPARADYAPTDPMRFTVWNPGLMSKGGVPNRTTIYTTLQASTYGTGATDASTAIQAAIDACPAGSVVQLSSGTFTVNDVVIISKGITLRGAGTRQALGAGGTLLQKTNGAVFNVEGSGADSQPIVIIGPSRWPGSDDTSSKNLAADAAKGAMSVTVANASGFTVGRFVLLDELSGASWQTDKSGQASQIWASSDYRVMYAAHKPNIEYVDDFNPDDATTLDPLSWFMRRDRPTSEIKEIASIAGNVVTFLRPCTSITAPRIRLN